MLVVHRHNLTQPSPPPLTLQDPAVWQGGLVARVAREALTVKYTFLPHLYSLFFEHALEGGTVVRPLWHEFPADRETWAIDDQFMWGSSFLVSPILEKGVSTRQAYLPTGANWYDFHEQIQVRKDFRL